METLVQIYANNPSVPHNNEQPSIIKLNAAFIAFTDSIIILRILVRARIVKHIATEDYLMVAAGTRHGLGRHIYDLPQMTLIENVKKVIQTLWVSQVLYATALSLVKISIIASFHRIFPTKPLRWTMYSLGGLILAVWIVNIFTTLFQCSPIYAAWDFQAIKPKCLPIMKVYYFSTAFSILTDVLLCVLPLPFLWKLKLPLQEKYIVSALFGFGLFAAVASIMRITVLHNVQSVDVTIATVPALNWSVVEVGTGIICACVPCLKPLFKKLLPGRFFSNAHPSRNGGLSRAAHGPAEGAEMRRMSRPAAIVKVGSMKSARSTVRTREFV